MAGKGVNGPGVAATAAGSIFLWAAWKGASIPDTLRALLTGKQPTGAQIHPIRQTQYTEASGAGSVAAGGAIGLASANLIVQQAASHKGDPYVFGAGHGGNNTGHNPTDCSSYVSKVLNELGLMHGVMATGGLAHIGKGVPYAQRSPGDIIVWNGGTGGGHTGIIASIQGNGGEMWNNPCTSCGGVQLSKYPFGSRTAAAAVIRRVV